MTDFAEFDEEAVAPRLTAVSALANLATRLGIETTAEQLCRRFVLSEGEPGSDALIAMAKELGLKAQRLQVTFAELPRLAKTLPAILRARDGKALILEAVHSDPMKGTVALVREPDAPDEAIALIEEDQLAEVWEGEVLLLKRQHGLADESQAFGIGWLLAQVLRENKLFLDIGISALVSTVFALVPAFISMIVVHSHWHHADL